ncbi:MAG: complex I subunit 5 family protein [Candidatus Methanomethylicia archaeon]|nr:complex I subunit 5 family protein [Candidatus Methanomethylicia archaeon]
MNIELMLIFALLFLSSSLFLIFKLRIALITSTIIILIALIINTSLLYNSFIKGIPILQLNVFLMSEIILIVGLTSNIYSYHYFNFSDSISGKIFFALIPPLLATLIGLSAFNNIIIMLFFLEASTFLSAILVLYGERRDKAVFSTFIYLVISVVESIFIISGLYLLTREHGLNLALADIYALKEYNINLSDLELASYLILLGFGIKAGVSPIALLWLPLVHSEAPSPISAILSGVIIESAYIPMLKYSHVLKSQISASVGSFIVFSGLVNVLIGSVGMIVDRDLKRVLAFSSISSMGGIGMALGLGLLSSMYESYIFLLGSILYLFAHSFAKALLFMCAGVIIRTFHERNWFKLHQMVKSLPITSVMWIIGTISISGLFPFTSGYYGKHLIIESINTLKLNVLGIPKYIYSLSLYFASITILCILMAPILLSFKGSGKFKEQFNSMFTMLIVLTITSVILGVLYSTFHYPLHYSI